MPLPGVDQRARRCADADVDAVFAQSDFDFGGSHAGDGEGDDAALAPADIVNLDAVDGAQAGAQLLRQARDLRFEVFEPDIERIVDRAAETQLGGIIAFPVFEAACIGAQFVAVGIGPAGGE